MRKILQVIFSQEFLFVLFLNAGFYKTVIPLNDYIDLTLLTLLLSVGLVIINANFNIRISYKALISSLLFLSFIAVMFITIIYTPDSMQGLSKTLQFAIIGGWSFLGPFFIFKNRESIERFLYGYLILGFITALESIHVYITSMDEFRHLLVFNSDYLAVGRILGYSLCVIIPFLLFHTMDINKRAVFVTLLFLNIFALVLTGARGPLLASLLVFFFFFIRQIKFDLKTLEIRYNKFSVFGLFAMILGIIYFLKTDIPLFNNLKLRLSHFMTEGGGASVSSRVEKFSTAFEMISEKPILGNGINSFQHFINIPNDYPHNIFLEIWSELGILGLILFLLLITYSIVQFPFITLKQNTKFKTIGWALLAMFIFSFINSNISGNIQGNRILFTLTSSLIAFSIVFKRDSQI